MSCVVYCRGMDEIRKGGSQVALGDDAYLELDEQGEPRVLKVASFVGPWLVRASRQLAAPFRGPDHLEVFFHGGPPESLDEAVDAAEEGITVAVLRRIPMQEINNRIKRLEYEVYGRYGWPAVHWQIPERVETDRDLAVVAAAYLEVADRGHPSPIELLARQSGISRNTVSARVRRARERGLIESEAGKSGGRLTAKAVELLKGEANE
jgi:hypothetical protein